MFAAPKTTDLTPSAEGRARCRGDPAARRARAGRVRRRADPWRAERPALDFDPAALPDAGGKTVVLQCAGGKRSAMAVDHAARPAKPSTRTWRAALPTWKAAGLPTVAG